jgi:LytS/YehU family sensor histidine kinase
VSALASDKSFRELFGIEPANYMYLFEFSALPLTVGSMTLAIILKVAKNRIQSQWNEQQLEKNQLETELKLLRMQFNPHFLFNTTNAILTLINKNPRQASDSLAKFADLLRYQLYECNVQQISLTTELNYIENFVTLALRLLPKARRAIDEGHRPIPRSAHSSAVAGDHHALARAVEGRLR